MLEANLKAVNKDMKTLVKDAQELFSAATSLSGEKADELRGRGMRLLDDAVSKAQDVQASAMQAGKEMAVSTDGYVKENPWRVIAVSAGAGLLLGAIQRGGPCGCTVAPGILGCQAMSCVLLLATDGYVWTVVPVEQRNTYMAALAQASSHHNIGPFAQMLAHN